MIRLLNAKRFTPIGVDLGSRSVKLIQFHAERSELAESVRWDLPSQDDGAEAGQPGEKYTEAIRQAREGRRFHGRDAVLSLGHNQLFLQNIRVEQLAGDALTARVHQEAANRLPYPVQEAEIRYIETIDVRQADSLLREVILLACHRPALDALLAAVEGAGLRPVGVDIEPAAMLRSYTAQFRRDEDKKQSAAFVHFGYSSSCVVISEDGNIRFIKYIDRGGLHLDDAVAHHLQMQPAEAAALRRHNGDRRSDQQDPEIARSVSEATRPVLEQWATEIARCLRYHSVTFRGKPLSRLILGGGEATPQLAESLTSRLNLKCELGDPLRGFSAPPTAGRKGQWDIAAGLALRELN